MELNYTKVGDYLLPNLTIKKQTKTVGSPLGPVIALFKRK